jgi:hypothetical protein
MVTKVDMKWRWSCFTFRKEEREKKPSRSRQRYKIGFLLWHLRHHRGPFKWYRSRGHHLIEGLTTFDSTVVFNHVGGKAPFFDSTCYDYWKRKIKMYLGSINDQVWDVTESDYDIIDSHNLTTKIRPTSNAIQWLSTPSTMPSIPRCLSK